jgi:hypothetical protein
MVLSGAFFIMELVDGGSFLSKWLLILLQMKLATASMPTGNTLLDSTE